MGHVVVAQVATDVGGVHGVPGGRQETVPGPVRVDALREDEDGPVADVSRLRCLVARTHEDTSLPLRVDKLKRPEDVLLNVDVHSPVTVDH